MPWWEGMEEERFWVEITDRANLGFDLAAPQRNEEGQSYWSYDFVTEVAEGDVVLHCAARPNNAVTHWSRAISEPYEDTLIWVPMDRKGDEDPSSPTSVPLGGGRWKPVSSLSTSRYG